MGLFCLTHEFVFPEGKPRSCPYCEVSRLHGLLERAHGMILHGPASSASMHRLTDEIGRTIGLKTEAELLAPRST